jgi:hypothetical protein
MCQRETHQFGNSVGWFNRLEKSDMCDCLLHMSQILVVYIIRFHKFLDIFSDFLGLQASEVYG